MNREDVLRKIKACMRLSKSANEAEAAAALRQAAKLMEAHQIDEDALEEAEREPIEERTFERRGMQLPIYVGALARTVADAFGCACFVSSRLKRDLWKTSFVSEVHFVGASSAGSVCEYSFTVLLRQLESHRRKFLSRVRKARNRNARGDMFGLGWVSAVERVLGYTAPVDQRLQRYMKQNHPNLKSEERKPRASKAVTQDDFHAGYSDGKKAQLKRGLGTEKRALAHEVAHP